MVVRKPQELADDTEEYARELVAAFHDAVRLARVDDSAPEPDALQLRQLTGVMAERAGSLEEVVSQLKHAAVVREGRECEELVVRTAERYDALAQRGADELAAIAREVDEAVAQIEAELRRGSPHAGLGA